MHPLFTVSYCWTEKLFLQSFDLPKDHSSRIIVGILMGLFLIWLESDRFSVISLCPGIMIFFFITFPIIKEYISRRRLKRLYKSSYEGDCVTIVFYESMLKFNNETALYANLNMIYENEFCYAFGIESGFVILPKNLCSIELETHIGKIITGCSLKHVMNYI